jgi:pimeloyl-ACP methyl ester carboxylesterase
MFAAASVGVAYRFALIYRVRAGYPHRHPLLVTPTDLGMPYEDVEIPTSGGLTLPGWFIPAGPDRGPGVVLVHGWESARDRMLPIAVFLRAVGFHTLTFDVRGNGLNPPEKLPLSAGEYGGDAAAAVDALLGRDEVSRVAVLGHSMGGIGALLAAGARPQLAAVVAISAPADPYRLTRQTFRLARLPIPGPIAWPLAWLTTHVYLRPRGHSVVDISATEAIRRYAGPILLIHGAEDDVVPVGHVRRLAAAAQRRGTNAQVETVVIPGGGHSWLYEFAAYRASVARFLAQAAGGPLPPDVAAATAAAVDAERIREPEGPEGTLAREPGGFRSLARIARRVPAPYRGAGTAQPVAPDAAFTAGDRDRGSDGPTPSPAPSGGG